MLVRFPVVPPHPADREARLAGAADFRRQPRLPADRRGRGAAAARLQGRRPDAGRARFWPACSPAPTPAPSSASMVGIPATIAGEWIALPVRDRLRLCRRRPARDLPQGSDLALLAAVLHRPAPQGVAAGEPVPDRVGGHPAGRADRARDPAAVPRRPLQPSRPHRASSTSGADRACGSTGWSS